jgi:hypothetical protein
MIETGVNPRQQFFYREWLEQQMVFGFTFKLIEALADFILIQGG